MLSTNRLLGIILLACLLLGVGGCAVNLPDSQGEENTAATPEATAPDDTGEPAAPLRGPTTPNPYLQNPAVVSASARRAFGQAVSALRQKNYAKAEVLLQELTVSDSQLSGPFYNLGLLYQQTDKPEQANTAYQNAIKANPNNLMAYNQLGILARQQGEFEKAEAYYQQALNVWPEHAPSHRNLAILYDLYMGKLEPALEHYQRYQQLLPSDDRQVTGWIVDLQRRLNSSNTGAAP